MAANWNNNQQWNIVDVRGADALLRYGRVIDCVKEAGLLIDYGDGKPPRQAPFGHIYGCKLEEFIGGGDETTENLLVDVLLRLQASEPAKWYLGALLVGDFDLFGSFALVRLTSPEALVVVPGKRIRRAQGRGQFLVTRGHFVKEIIRLPSGVCSEARTLSPYTTPPADQHLVERFNGNCAGPWMIATHIDGSALHVLTVTEQYRRLFDRQYRPGCPEVEGDRFNTFLRMLGTMPQTQRKRPNGEEDAITKRIPSVPACPTPPGAPVTCQCLTCTRSPAVIPNWGCPLKGSPASGHVPHSQPTATTRSSIVTPTTPDCSSSLSEVPKEVLTELLECLDGVQQTRVRRVCSTWNDLLTTFHMSRLFRVPEEYRLFEPIGARVCLLKRWTAQTKVIVYSAIASSDGVFDIGEGDSFAEEQHCGSLLCTGRFFRGIFEEKQLPRLDTLFLDNLAWEWRGRPTQHSFSNFINHIHSELNSFASVCHHLVVRKISVMLSGNKIPIVVRLMNTRMEGQVPVDTVWDSLDKSQSPISREDEACWREWSGRHLNSGSSGPLVEILNECQSADPRDSNRFRGKAWTRGDLAALDLDKLNRITAHNLVKASCYKKPVLDW